jgi:hypothetical protein
VCRICPPRLDQQQTTRSKPLAEGRAEREAASTPSYTIEEADGARWRVNLLIAFSTRARGGAERRRRFLFDFFCWLFLFGFFCLA